MDQLSQIIEQYGIYAVFALCTVEGDITLLISGAMAHSNFFGKYSFFKVFLAGTLGGMVGDSFGYAVGRIFHEKAKDYRFYQMAQPRIERLIDKFGGFAIVISKYIYGIRAAMCVFYGIGRMPFHRFLILDAISCGIWVTVLAGTGYFFSGAITTIIGDFQHIGIALFFVILFAVIVIYAVERFWLSEKVEEANPATINKIEEKLHAVEGAAQEKLHGLGERLHLTREPNREEKGPIDETRKPESTKTAKK
ncbi:MAG TPA: DedA family protein [Pyrinomonadaceae bacterium]|nr:DedA family protein [Pyrinomonadaceae bacterium]